MRFKILIGKKKFLKQLYVYYCQIYVLVLCRIQPTYLIKYLFYLMKIINVFTRHDKRIYIYISLKYIVCNTILHTNTSTLID